jgi:hypothetical protein
VRVRATIYTRVSLDRTGKARGQSPMRVARASSPLFTTSCHVNRCMNTEHNRVLTYVPEADFEW